MKPRLRSCAVAAVLRVAGVAAGADLRQLQLDGALQAAGGERSAQLRILCQPDPDGGAVGLELRVPQAFKLKDFDYDDFEGPDAAAASRELSRVSVDSGSARKEIAHAASGWYSGDDPDTFVFGVTQFSHKPGEVADLLRVIGPDSKQIVWVQAAFDDSKRQLRAVFALDAAKAKAIRDAVDACLES